jgi:hypothetical protein
MSVPNERAFPHIQDQKFFLALEDSKWLSDIHPHLFSAQRRITIAQAEDALAGEVVARSDDSPEHALRTRNIAAEVCKTLEKEGNL